MSASYVTESITAQIDKIKVLFKEIDKDCDGIIGRSEFAQIFLFDGSDWTQEEVDDLLTIVDINGHGAISYEEFVDWTMNGSPLTSAITPESPEPPLVRSLVKSGSARDVYLDTLIETYGYVQDAITGCRLRTCELQVSISPCDNRSDKGARVPNLVRTRSSLPMEEITTLVPGLLDGIAGPAPVLLLAAPGAGKSFALIKLVHSLATHLKQSAAEKCLLPILIPMQQIARRRSGEAAVTPYFVREYIREEFSAHVNIREMLECAFDEGNLIVLLDGMDAAAGLKESIERMVFDELAPSGSRVVATSRLEGMSSTCFKSKPVTMELVPLSDQQELDFIEKQFHGDARTSQFYGHLLAACKIRNMHDRIYIDEVLPNVEDRNRLESFSTADLFKRADGAYDPDMRQKVADGSRIITSLNDASAPGSQYLHSLTKIITREHLDRIDYELLRYRSGSISEDQIRNVASELPGLEPQEIQLPHDVIERVTPIPIVENLISLVKKLQVQGTADKHLTASELWARIMLRTDELFIVMEQSKAVLIEIIKSVLTESNLGPENFQIDPMKDPTRVHEDSLQYYSARFADDGLPEACVTDVLRCSIVCSNAIDILKILRKLQKGFAINVRGSQASLKLVRCENWFSRKSNPLHFRNMRTDLQLCFGSARVTSEMRVDHKKILEWHESSQGQQTYAFFNDFLSSNNSGELNDILYSFFNLFVEIQSHHISLRLLIIVLTYFKDGCRLPSNVQELHSSALDSILRHRLSNIIIDGASDNLSHGKRLLNFIAFDTHCQLKAKVFDSKRIELILSQKCESILLCLWQALRERTEGIPLIRTLSMAKVDTHNVAEFQFEDPSFQDYFAAMAILQGTARPTFWSNDQTAAEALNDSFNTNLFNIGGATLLEVLTDSRCKVDFFDHSLTEQGWQALEAMQVGTSSIHLTGLALSSFRGALKSMTQPAMTKIHRLSLQGAHMTGELANLASLNLRVLVLEDGLRVSGDLLDLNLACMEKLHLSGCPDITGSIDMQTTANLETLFLSECPQITGNLECLRSDGFIEHRIRKLHLEDCMQIEGELADVGQAANLNDLHIMNCPGVRGSIAALEFGQGASGMETSLHLEDCPEIDGDLADLADAACEMRSISISNCPSIRGNLKPLVQKSMNSLQKLHIDECPNIEGELADLGNVSSLNDLRIASCPSIRGDLHELQFPRRSVSGEEVKIHLEGCPEISGNVEDLAEEASTISVFHLVNCPSIKGNLNPLVEKSLSQLKKLHVEDCPDIHGNLDALTGASKLEHLHIGNAPSIRGDVKALEKLPSLKSVSLKGGNFKDLNGRSINGNRGKSVLSTTFSILDDEMSATQSDFFETGG